jgi:hypothetical protein
MATTKQYRAPSNEFGDLVEAPNDPSRISKSQDSQDSFSSLADNEKWLADNSEKMLQPPTEAPVETLSEKPNTSETLPADEERVLRCLGASVIMRWNTLPAKLQRELFDAAGSMDELLDTAALRGQIARFLHNHKDDTPAAQ